MNEELQSTNEELQTTNDELRLRSEELADANAFLQSVLSSLDAGVVVVDRELRVVSWNRRAEDQWGLRADEVHGQHFLGLDIGLPVVALKGAAIAALTRGEPGELEVDATNRRGAPVRCRVRCLPLPGAGGVTRGLIVTMETALRDPARGGNGDGAPAPAARKGAAPRRCIACPRCSASAMPATE